MTLLTKLKNFINWLMQSIIRRLLSLFRQENEYEEANNYGDKPYGRGKFNG